MKNKMLGILSLVLAMTISGCGGRGDISKVVGTWANKAKTRVAQVNEEGQVKVFEGNNASVIGEISEKEAGLYEISLSSEYKDAISKTNSEAANVEITVKLVSEDQMKMTMKLKSAEESEDFFRVNAKDVEKLLEAVKQSGQFLPGQPGQQDQDDPFGP